MYSGIVNSALGTGFVVSRECNGSIMEFKPINERIWTVRIRARLFNITLVCVQCMHRQKGPEKRQRTDFMESWKMCEIEQWAMKLQLY